MFGVGMLGAVARAVRQLFSPASLFAAGEPGAWYDPSDMSTLFQDSAGTTPVTAVEQPVGLMLDKSKGLVLGPELVTNGTFDTDTSGWSVLSTATMTASDGGLLVSRGGASFVSQPAATINLQAGKTYKIVGEVVSAPTAGNASIGIFAANRLTERTTPGVMARNTVGQLTSVFTATVTETAYIIIGISVSGTGTVEFDNISVRELPGNHAFQSTAASRPVLSARVNLLTKTEQFNDSVWTTTGTKGAILNGLTTVSFSTTEIDRRSVFTHAIQEPVTAAGQQVILRGRFAVNASMPTIALGWSRSTRFGWAAYNTLTATWSTYDISSPGTFQGLVAEEVSSGVWDITVIATASVNFPTAILAHAGTGSASDLRLNAPIGSVSVGFVDARVANDGVGLPAYQRVNTSTDYDTAGFPMYLRFDGVDDGMVTNSINFTSTDKMTVWAGVRKLSDAATGVVAELSVTGATNNGIFTFFAPGGANSASYSWRSKGSISIGPDVFNVPSPRTDVTTGIGDISGDSAILRINGTQAASSTADQGTGNYGNYPLYIGRRGGSQLPFNGRLHSLIIRGAQSTAEQIAATETYVNSKTRAY